MQSVIRIRVRATRQQVVDYLRKLPSICAGRAPDVKGVSKSGMIPAIAKLMELNGKMFDKKSDHQTGDDGEYWPDISPYTAKKRKTHLQFKSRAKGHYARGRKQRMSHSEAFKEAGRQAASEEPILNENGQLRRASGSGQVHGAGLSANYYPPDGQAVRYMPGRAEITCTLPYASRHMGDGRSSDLNKPVPKRAPYVEQGKMPDSWSQQISEAYRDGLADGLAQVLPTL